VTREFHVDRAIRGEGETRALGAVVATLATRQHGVLARTQLRALAISDDVIDRWIAARRLNPLHRGVYAVGHRRLTGEARYLAAVLFAGDGGVLSHCSAADLWGLRATKEPGIDVIGSTHRRGNHQVRIHQVALQPTDVMTRNGIPVTKPLRTILDLARCIPQRELEKAIRQAEYAHLTTTALLAEAVQHHAGRRGMTSLRRALINLGGAPGRTRSDLEEDFIRFLRRHRLPMHELNVAMRVARQPTEADCLWREHKLIVELDGRDAHDSTPAFESDRARDLRLLVAGWRVARVTSRRMRFDGQALARELRALLV
jgi:very-short-patch-repair endonuclease